MYTVNSQKETFSNYYPVKINYKVSIFIYCGFCAKKLSTKSLLLAGQKLLYKESASVTFMQEKTKNPKQNSIHTKKARCKIFTNSYKNSKMNKLISSTFLYCPHLSSCFSSKWKRVLANVVKGKEAFYHVSFTPLINREHEIPVQLQL